MTDRLLSLLLCTAVVASLAQCRNDKAPSGVDGATDAGATTSAPGGSATRERAQEPIFLPPGEGRAIELAGGEGQLVFKLGGGESGSTFEFAESRVPPNGGPPEHIHLDTDEAFYVASGTFRVKVGERMEELGPGSFVFAPRGLPHVFVNTGATEGTLLIVDSPTKWEAYMREVTEALRRMPPGPPDQQVLNAISDRYRVRVVGPPLGSGVELEKQRNR